MKMFKKMLGNQKLLGNQRGMSLIEVMIAASMAVATSLVVMKVSENANKATKKMESDNELADLDRMLINNLTDPNNCFLSMDNYDLDDPSGPQTDPTAPQDYGDATTEYTTPGIFKLVTQANPGPVEVAFINFVAGERVPRHPLWIIDEIRVYEIVEANAANEGICQVLFDLSRDVGEDNKRMNAIVDKKVQVSLSCSVDPGGTNNIRGCTSINGLANSYWSLINTAVPSYGIKYDDRVYATDHLVVGDTPLLADISTAEATLDVQGNADIHTDLNVKANTTIGGTTTIAGATTIGGATTINNTANVTGNTTLGANLSVAGTGTVNGFFQVNDDAYITGYLRVGNYVQIDSDKRLKKDELVIENASDKLDEINGYTYVLKRTGDEHIGFFAQELEKVFPQAVHTGPDGYLSVSYHMLIPVLVEAHKEQKAIIKDQQAEIDKLRQDVKFLYDEVQKIKRRQEPNYWPLIYP